MAYAYIVVASLTVTIFRERDSIPIAWTKSRQLQSAQPGSLHLRSAQSVASGLQQISVKNVSNFLLGSLIDDVNHRMLQEVGFKLRSCALLRCRMDCTLTSSAHQ